MGRVSVRCIAGVGTPSESLEPGELVFYLGRLRVKVGYRGEWETTPPTSAQMRYILLHNGIPFVGFGFLDNAIMIAAGTQIELSIGVTLGISTMAAAALGNLVSDLAGLGLGMQGPELTPKQADMWQTRLSAHLGKAIGICIGCLLGMFPLLFISEDEEDDKKSHSSDNNGTQ
ncbi:hypothetical protein NL108_012737 [Boleophthalmus pectinirostris]|nr:hypothetical protein NL108_012737 [Boleophthalmus pectinirostris]